LFIGSREPCAVIAGPLVEDDINISTQAEKTRNKRLKWCQLKRKLGMGKGWGVGDGGE
jgi:hypothetical protein